MQGSEDIIKRRIFLQKPRPWKLMFSKKFFLRAEAMKFEKYLKSLKNKKYIMSKILENKL